MDNLNKQQQMLSDLREIIAQMHTAGAAYQRKIEELNAEVQNLNEARSVLSAKLRNVETENNRNIQDLENERKIRKEWQNRYTDADRELKDLRVNKETVINEYREKIDSLDRLERGLHAKEERVKDDEVRAKQKWNELKDWKAGLNQRESDVADRESLQAKNNELQNIINQLRDDNKDLQEKRDWYKGEKEHFEQLANQYREGKEYFEQQTNQYKGRVEELESNLRDRDEEKKNSEGLIVELRGKIQELSDKITGDGSIIKSLKEKAKKWEEKAQGFESDVKDWKDKYKELKKNTETEKVKNESATDETAAEADKTGTEETNDVPQNKPNIEPIEAQREEQKEEAKDNDSIQIDESNDNPNPADKENESDSNTNGEWQDVKPQDHGIDKSDR